MTVVTFGEIMPDGSSNGLDERHEMGPCVSESQRRTVESWVQVGVKEGARLIAGGHALAGEGRERGWFHEPTVFTDVKPTMRIAREEIFGPVLSIIPVDGFDEAIRVANDVEYGLSGAIFTRDVNKAFRAIRDIEAGIFYVNSSTIGADMKPRCGTTPTPPVGGVSVSAR